MIDGEVRAMGEGKYPVSAGARAVERGRLAWEAMNRAQRETRERIRSRECGAEEPLHAGRLGGCMHTARQCLCECHDGEFGVR